MDQLSEKAIGTFLKEFNACAIRVGGGRVACDTSKLRELVRKSPAAAKQFVEIYCMMAQSNPLNYQGAMAVAMAYQVEFGDASLMGHVVKEAQASGQTEALGEIGISPKDPAV